MARSPLGLAVLSLSLLLLVAPARAEERPYADWSSQLDRVVQELKNSRSLNDRIAFQNELAQLVRQDVQPQAQLVTKLRELLPVAPEGVLLDAIAEVLLAHRSAGSLRVLFDAFDRTDYVNLQGKKVGENGVDMRLRCLEYHATCVADAGAAAVAAGAGVPELAADAKDLLLAELPSESARRTRVAALLLGGWGVRDAVGELVEAFERRKDDAWTRAILLEAIGRTDPARAGAAVLASVGSSETSEKLAAIPVLGHLEGKDAEKALGKALADKRWYVARAAVEACARRRDRGAVGLLVERLAEASPRLEREIVKVLQDMVGSELPSNPPDILPWWTAVKDGFDPRPRGAPPETPRAGATRTRNAPSYFSQTVDSDRMTLVIDVSQTMGEGRIKVQPPEGTTGEPMAGTKFEVMMQQLARLLQGFRGEFNIVAYANEVKPFKEKLVAANKANVKAADAYLGQFSPGGETNMFDAITKALDDAEVDTVFLLSDGLPNLGPRVATTDILEGIERINRFRKVAIHTIQLGPDQELMRRIAARNGGNYRNVETQPAARPSR